MTELAEMQKMNESRGLSLAPVGGLEVYFMGLRLSSKILTGRWPDPDAIANRCKEAFKQYNAGQDIAVFENLVKQASSAKNKMMDSDAVNQSEISLEDEQMDGVMVMAHGSDTKQIRLEPGENPYARIS